jgi:hypothetical protein
MEANPMRSLAYLLLALVVAPASLAGETVTSTRADRTSVAVTVYNDGRGLVREERTLELPAGTNEVRFMDVAEKVEAPTVHVAVLDGRDVSVLEQNYEYDLLSPQKLLEKFVGETLTLVQQRRVDGSDVEESVDATLLSTNDGTVWRIGGRIVANPPYRRLVFPSVPENLIAQPTLVWLVDADGAGRRRIEAAYLTGGLSWRADYVLALDPDEARGGLQGWVTLENRSGATYDDARLKLVAGDVHRAPEERPVLPQTLEARAMAAAPMPEEAFFEYHLYTLPRPTTLKQNQTKQVQLLDAPRVALEKDYVLRGTGRYYRGPWPGDRGQEKVQVLLKLRNSEDAGLGTPLPKGIVRVYKRDSTGSPQFIGEDRIDHTPRDEEVELELGNAFDISVDRKQTDFERIAERVFESAYEVRLRSAKETPITVRVIEPIGGDWTMLSHSHPFEKTEAFEATFTVPVTPGEEAVLRYRVRVEY